MPSQRRQARSIAALADRALWTRPFAGEMPLTSLPSTRYHQIEASAGTGKTWNICALYVRLLLEKNLNADQILVVTFTKAATAELHERIRGRLAELHRAIEMDDDGDDPFIRRLFETTLAPESGIEREAALKVVRRALRTKRRQIASRAAHACGERRRSR